MQMLVHAEVEQAQSAAVQAHTLEAQAYAHAEAQAHTIAHMHSLEAQAQAHAQQAHQAQVQAHSLSVQAQSLQVTSHSAPSLLCLTHVADRPWAACACENVTLCRLSAVGHPLPGSPSEAVPLTRQLFAVPWHDGITEWSMNLTGHMLTRQATAQHLEAKAQEIHVLDQQPLPLHHQPPPIQAPPAEHQHVSP